MSPSHYAACVQLQVRWSEAWRGYSTALMTVVAPRAMLAFFDCASGTVMDKSGASLHSHYVHEAETHPVHAGKHLPQTFPW